MKKLISYLCLIGILISTVAVFSVCVGAQTETAEPISVWDGTVGTDFDGGKGTADDPYLISSAKTLAYLAKYVNDGGATANTYYKMTCSMDLDDISWTAIGKYYPNSLSGAKFFFGTFDGSGHVIYNLNSSTAGDNGYYMAGLFGLVYGGVKNVGIESGTVSVTQSTGYGGGIAALFKCVNNVAVISNCYSKATVTDETPNGNAFIGGIVGGMTDSAKISGCVNYGNVENVSKGGAICGIAVGTTTIENCFNVCTQTNYIVANKADTVTVTNCNSTAPVCASGEYFITATERGALWGAKITSADMTLDESISIRYYAEISGSKYETKQMTFVMNDRTVTVGGALTENTDRSEYVFVFDGVAPQNIGDNISATLVLNGKNCATKTDYTIAEYLKNISKKTASSALKTLVADILEYGAAAQLYVGYKTDALVNADNSGMTEFTVLTSAYEKELSASTSDIALVAAGINFANVNRLYYKVKATSVSGVSIRIGDESYTKLESSGEYYIVYTNAVAPTYFDTVYTVELQVNGSTVQTLKYSVAAYVYSMQNNTDNANMAGLAKALYNYGVAARAYAAERIGEGGGHYISALTFQNSGESNFRIPNLITTNDGKVFAFANDRRQSVMDDADIQWICYSVADDGVNFSEIEYLLCEEGWRYIIGAAVYDEVNDNIMLFYQSHIMTDEVRDAYWNLSIEERAKHPLGHAIIESSDGGKTWTSRAINMPQVLIESEERYVSTHGASAGIQLKNGEHEGRLVVAGKVGWGNLNSVRQEDWVLMGCLIYSDDYGKTWKLCEDTMPVGTDETTLCELPDGTLYISSRTISNKLGRTVGYSYDGGQTLEDIRFDDSLEVQSQLGVKGSLICVENYDGKGNSLTLFSSLNSPSPFRRGASIWLSYDEGETWSDIVTIDSGYTSYTEMCYNKVTKKITIVYELGEENCYDMGMQIETFDIEWLLVTKRPNESLRQTDPVDENVTAELVTDGLLVQLNGDGMVNFTTDKTWKNSIGQTNAQASTGTACVVQSALNGEDVMSFDGMSGITVSGLNQLTGDITYFIVYKSDIASFVGADSEPTLFKTTHSNGIRTFVRSMPDSMTTYLTGGYYVEAEEFIDTGWHILAVTWSGANEDTALISQFMDGNDSVKFEVGAYAQRNITQSGTQTIAPDFSGDVAEVLIYNRALSDTEVAATGMALAEKFGLEWNI